MNKTTLRSLAAGFILFTVVSEAIAIVPRSYGTCDAPISASSPGSSDSMCGLFNSPLLVPLCNVLLSPNMPLPSGFNIDDQKRSLFDTKRCFGAVAQGRQGGKYRDYVVWNRDSSFEAATDAVEFCKRAGATKCREAIRFRSTAAGYRYREAPTHWAQGDDIATANDLARARCGNSECMFVKAVRNSS